MTHARPVLTIDATEDAATGAVRLRLAAAGEGALRDRTIVVSLGGHALLRATPGTATVFEAVVPCDLLRRLDDYGLAFRDQDGTDLAEAADWVLRGDVFAALRVDANAFLDRVQLHHSRFASLFLVEIAARAFYLRHPTAEFALRAAALTILGHRLLERPARTLAAEDLAQVAWLVAEAGLLVPQGEALIAAAEAAGRAPDWRHVRWTVSLATVAGHLALYDEDYDRALGLLGMATRQVPHVGIARVSGLNLVICAYAEGLVAHLLARPAQAAQALRAGVDAVKPIVVAQDLFENVWVMGDLENVLLAARQCYIALLRLGLLVPPPGAPVIDPPTQIATALVRSPLSRILASGRVPRLAAMLRDAGGK